MTDRKKIVRENNRRPYQNKWGMTTKQIKKALEDTNKSTSVSAKSKSPIKKAERPQRAVRSFQNADSIFITGGIGDVFALESYFSDHQREQLTSIVYATNKHQMLKELFENLPNYPNLKKHIVAWDNWDDLWCFFSKSECVNKILKTRSHITHSLEVAEDWSILRQFENIRSGIFQYNNSSFLQHKLTDVSHFNLPSNYICVCPYSTDKRILDRDFNKQDWIAAKSYLNNTGMKGVVLNKGDDDFPENDNFIVLSNQTTVSESVEIMKSARGYIGIDSFLSVLASKIFSEHLQIKSVNDHCRQNKEIYFAPKNNPRLTTKIQSNTKSVAIKRRSLNIVVPQGLGDIFWVYQKFSPHVNDIHFKIATISDNKIQKRSEGWVELFPKVKSVTCEKVSPYSYKQIATGHYYMEEVLHKNSKDVTYGCNRWLEEGVRLENVDDYKVEWDIPLPSTKVPIPYDQYITLYVSGSTKHIDPKKNNAWGVDDWLEMVDLFYDKYSLDLPVVIIGAKFDKEVIEELSERLNVENTSFVQAEPAQVIYILQQSEFFLGYQSGLGIIADNLDTPQLMMYFDFLEPMQYTWCKNRNIQTKFFADTFNSTPKEVIENLKWGKV